MKKLYIISGQSNAGQYTTTQLGTVSGVNSFNINTRLWENYMDCTRQYYTGLGGPAVPLAQALKVKYPTDDLYFYQYHKGSTDMSSTGWNSHTGALFFNLLDFLEMALAQVTPDEINVIWMQGENDSKTSALSVVYGQREYGLFSYLKRTYNIGGVFIDYKMPDILPTGYDFKGTVNNGKAYARDVFGSVLIDPNGFEYNGDNIHLSLANGIGQFATACMNYL